MGSKAASSHLLKGWKKPWVRGAVGWLIAAAAGAMLTLGPAASAQKIPAGELNTKDSEPTFKVQRNLVLVRAVVRNNQGQAVKGLTKEDFRILDNGKPQVITEFTEETPAASAAGEAAKAPSPEEVQPESVLASTAPKRFLALFFDDVHMDASNVIQARVATQKYLQSALRVGDRAAIYTSSGQGMVDFTDDRAQLDKALMELQPRPVIGSETHPCPPLLEYQAFLMVHRRDPQAVDLATQETLQCRHLDNPNLSQAELQQAEQVAAGEADAAAYQLLNHFETETETVLREIDHLEQRMAVLPGQRSIVLISPGFLTVTARQRLAGLVDRALRSKVIINTVDVRGLYTAVPMGDITRDLVVLPTRPDLMGEQQSLWDQQSQWQAEPLSSLAADTGGVYFHDSNDLVEGLRQTGNLPEVYYVLAFSPQPLKYDGRFHNLSVKLVSGRGLRVEARRGYFAPAQPEDAAARADEEIRQAIYSQENLRGIPIEVHTQFFKRNEVDADLAVLTRVDLRYLTFQKLDGLNLNKLTVVTVLFDQNGNYVAGKEKLLTFRMRDVTLAQLNQTGLTMRTKFDVKPGTYLVREVVRDSEGANISGMTRTVEIPY